MARELRCIVQTFHSATSEAEPVMRRNTLARRKLVDPACARAQPAGSMAGLATSSEIAPPKMRSRLRGRARFLHVRSGGTAVLPAGVAATDTGIEKVKRTNA